MNLNRDARKKNTPKINLCERERENNNAKNGRENNKFIEDGVNMKR